MIKAFSYRPEYFNNNGDQGNLEALAHFTNSKIVPVEIKDADFVLFGDASRAAMRHFNDELEALTATLEIRLERNLPTLLVGSCYEFYAERIKGIPDLAVGKRVSEFREVTHGGITVKGYRNSEVLNQDLFVGGRFIGTTLFGPVLAKNPALLKLIASGLELEVRYSEAESGWIAKL